MFIKWGGYKKCVGGWMWCKYYVHIYESGEMRPV
jgi:hypothetical protein